MDLNSPETRYTMLRTALEMFQQPPAELDDSQSKQLQQRVNGELAIGKRLLQQADVAKVMVPEASVEQAFKQLAAGFDDDEAFDKTLAYNGLDRSSLREALRYDLSVEAALEQVVSKQAEVSEEEAEIYYLQHLERFTLPETRTVCHILITVNDDFPDNSTEQVRARMDKLHTQCASDGQRLKQLAMRHSECPSAMKEGVIGRVKPGQLYPQLDTVLFAMAEGAVSEIIESEVGLHIIYCEAIHPAETLSFEMVKEKVHTMLKSKKRATVLKQRLARA